MGTSLDDVPVLNATLSATAAGTAATLLATANSSAGKLATPSMNGQMLGGDSTDNKAVINTHNVFSCTVTSAYHIEGEVLGSTTLFMIDTGAAISLLRKDIWDKTSSDSIRMQPWPGQSLVAVDGSPLTVHGRVMLPVRLGNHKEEVTFAVTDRLTVEAIFGLDFLENNKCTLDLRRRTLTLSDSTTVLLSPSKPSAAEQLAVSATQTIRIPAASELEILAHITGAAPTHTYLLEQNPSKRLPVMVARALVTPTSPDIPV